jgi:hypothetical protein
MVDGKRDWTLHAAFVSAAGAVLAAAVGILGTAFAARQGAIPGAVATVTQTVTVQAADSGTAAGASSKGATTPVTVPGGGTVRHTTVGGTPITLNEGYDIDLDSTAADWSVMRAPGGQGYGDLLHDALGGQLVPRGSLDTARVPASANRNTCVRTTNWSSEWFQLRGANLPLTFCMHTSQQRFALVTVVAANADASSVQLDVTTWEERYA